jgi:uncharacterized protein (DUF2237 family)
MGDNGMIDDPQAENVLGTPLQVHSTHPMTGFYRDGFL